MHVWPAGFCTPFARQNTVEMRYNKPVRDFDKTCLAC
jgi:hypothetical protein